MIQITQTTPESLGKMIEDCIEKGLEKFNPTGKSVEAPYNDELLTREETISFLKIDSTTLWNWTRKGKVTAYGLGKRRYYKKSELIASLVPLQKRFGEGG
jgi:hypothetical protein